MKRDMDLIRELLLRLEALPMRPGAIVHIYVDESDPEDSFLVEGFSADQAGHHLHLIWDAGLIDGGNTRPMVGVNFRSLTWAGHDFLDSIRDPVVWDKTKKGALEAGGFTFDLLKDLAKGFIKKQIEERTGVAL